MLKRFCLQIFTLFTVFMYGQEITFHKNVSYEARKLKLIQKLNDSGDSLILECKKKQIGQVDILNEEYLESIDINGNKGKISLKKLPVGDYVIQAKLGRHWIVMYMEKKDDVNAPLINTEYKSSSALTKLNDENENTLYWVVYESNSRFASNKTMGLKYIDEIDDLITKIKLELKSEVGKNNKLFVYEVYNRSKFMKKQLRNRKYYKSKKSKFFNVLPIYNSNDEKNKNPES